METSTKNQNEQQQAKKVQMETRLNSSWGNSRQFLPQLILSQKQERATKSSKRQRTANGNTHQKPKRATKGNTVHVSFPLHSFTPILNLWKVADIKCNEKPERATAGNEKQ